MRVKQALHRSITFWSGILVISFTCWAWWDSLSHASWGHFRDVAVINTRAGVQISNVHRSMKGDASFLGFAVSRDTPPPTAKGYAPALTAPMFLRGGNGEGGTLQGGGVEDPETYAGRTRRYLANQHAGAWLVFIPHWMILLAAALSWTGLLGWRARRRGRGMAVLKA